MNPATGKKLGLEEGEWVWVEGPIGDGDRVDRQNARCSSWRESTLAS